MWHVMNRFPRPSHMAFSQPVIGNKFYILRVLLVCQWSAAVLSMQCMCCLEMAHVETVAKLHGSSSYIGYMEVIISLRSVT